MAAIAVGLVGAGVAMLVIDGGCASAAAPGHACRDLYDTATLGYGLIGAGAVAGTGAAWMFVTAPPAGAAQVMLGWRGWF
jgi:hypothetical protein